MSIKYCIWDVGQVIYPYTLSYLDEWAYSKTTDKKRLKNKGGVKKFNYNPYMSGEISDEDFCRSLCQEYYIPFEQKAIAEIKKALYDGVGNFFEETLETIQTLSTQNIQNCILSNALPFLEETAPKQIDIDYRFVSFKLGLLKPNPEIYKEVRRRLNCRFDEMIFVDDKEKNVQSAKNLGINGIVFNRNTIKSDCEKIIKKSNE